MRGYKGRIKGPHLVKKNDSAFDVGDEAILISRKVKASVIVSANRVKGLKFIEENQLADVVILDDGFQQRWLERDLNILTVNINSENELLDLQEERLLPYGRLRERIAPALRRTNLVVLNTRSSQPISHFARKTFLELLAQSNLNINLPVLEAKFINPFVKSVELPTRQLAPQEIVALSSIANPEAFFSTLIDLGFIIKGCYPFPDHHLFNISEIENIVSLHPGVPIICTTKDIVKLETFSFLKNNIYLLDFDLSLEPNEGFLQLLKL
jgi:tetraacyldisaccharide 4'-kinase